MIGSVLKRVNPRVVLVLLAALSVAFVSSVIAGDSKSKEESLDGYAAAIEIASKNAEVKSEADLVINMKNENSPLHALTEKGFRQFVSGLTFTEHGLGSLNYEPLVNELDEEGIYQIMKLFGVQFESSLYSYDVLDEGDRLLLEALSGGSAFLNFFDETDDSYERWNWDVCVRGDNGTTSCRPLPFNECFSNCADL